MARGQDAKARRKAARKEAREGNLNEFDQPPPEEEADESEQDGDKEPEIPLPPGMSSKDASSSDSSSDSDDDDTPKTRKKSKKSKKSKSAQPMTPAKKEQGIKTLPLIMLVLLTGTTLLPALLFLGDKLGEVAQKKHLLGNLGYRLGVGHSPKKRVMSFYEKHDPAKIEEVPAILSKYYGDYPKLVKRLERKYQDYGYFLNWEQDEAPMTLAFDQLKVTFEKGQEQFDRHAPEIVKTGARNVRHNLTFLYKRVRSVWKKKVWPVLQPYIGVPDAKTARQQKRADAEAAANAKGRRKKNTDYRDDPED